MEKSIEKSNCIIVAKICNGQQQRPNDWSLCKMCVQKWLLKRSNQIQTQSVLDVTIFWTKHALKRKTVYNYHHFSAETSRHQFWTKRKKAKSARKETVDSRKVRRIVRGLLRFRHKWETKIYRRQKKTTRTKKNPQHNTRHVDEHWRIAYSSSIWNQKYIGLGVCLCVPITDWMRSICTKPLNQY